MELREFYISEYEKFLENKGIDTVCFMGYGYKFEDVKVGAKFYLSYLYYGKMSCVRKGGSLENTLRSILIHFKSNPYVFFDDKFILIQKYKYYKCKALDHKNRKVLDITERREFVRIKNIRTGEIYVLNEEQVDNFVYFLFHTW